MEGLSLETCQAPAMNHLVELLSLLMEYLIVCVVKFLRAFGMVGLGFDGMG